MRQLADRPNIVCLKESAPDTRRFTDLYNAIADRFILFAGLDDVALEGLILGAKGWVSGLTNAFPKESLELYNAYKRGDASQIGRKNAIMAGQVANLSRQEIEDIAAYLSSLPGTLHLKQR